MKWYTSLLFLFFSLHVMCAASNPFLALSIPKCGTYLLYKCLYLITGKCRVPGMVNARELAWFFDGKYLKREDAVYNIENAFPGTHCAPIADMIDVIERYNAKVVLIIRDPRDQVVSGAHYLERYLEAFKDLSFDNKVKELIINGAHWTGRFVGGIRKQGSIDALYRKVLTWREYPYVYLVTFEDLVGRSGGGSQEKSIIEIMGIAAHIGHPISKERAYEIADELFGPVKEGGTESWLNYSFRKGKVGRWKTEFSDEHKNIFKYIAGTLLIDLGYENSLHW